MTQVSASCLLILAFFRASTTLETLNIPYSTWSRAPTVENMRSMRCLKLPEVKSMSECVKQCSPKDGCDAACYSHVISACYIVGTQSSSDCRILDDGGTYCFEQGSCPTSQGFSVHSQSGRCLYLGQKTMNKTDAEAACNLLSAHLYYLKTESDLPPLVDLMTERGYDIQVGWVVWLGGSDVLLNRVFLWGDNSPLLDDSPLWGNVQPDNLGGAENCVAYDTVKSTDGMYDRECKKTYMYVCELEL